MSSFFAFNCFEFLLNMKNKTTFAKFNFVFVNRADDKSSFVLT